MIQNVQFGSQSVASAGSITDQAAKAAERLFTAPDRIDQAVDKFVSSRKNGNIADKVLAGVVKRVGGFAKMMATFDYSEFPEVALGKSRFLISEPPIGAMILLLYPFTVGPRLYRAYERGKKNGNDFREVGDVLRRDMTAITIFLFMLKPLLKVMNKVMQKWAGLELVDLKKDKVLAFSQMKNYALDNTEALQQMLREGNGQGLLKAINTLKDRNADSAAEKLLQSHIKAMKEVAPQLVNAYENNPSKVGELAKRLISHIDGAEAIHRQTLEQAQQTGDKTLIKAAEKLQGEFRNVVTKYGKSRLLPVAMLGFAIVIGAIGWFPVWFNSFWNKSNFEKEQAAKRAADLSSYNPQLTLQALRGTSRLANGFQQFQA